MASSPVRLCRIEDIPDGGGKGFAIERAGQALEIFAVRRGAQVYVYQNRCPHTGVNLNWNADQFMSFDGLYIQCSLHFAQFRIYDGYCVYGPCAGQSLGRIQAELRKDEVWLV